ncbi:hypothetical protein BsWGS_24236 [Bradybaena similaris]
MSGKVSDLIRGTALTLQNRFAELMLVVGLDENTGLVPLRKDTDNDDEGEENFNHLFNDEYEAQVLVAISAAKALVFQPYIKEDLTYPPSAESLASMSNFHTVKSRSDKHTPGKHTRNTLAHHTIPINPAVVRQHLAQNENPTSSSSHVHDLPLSKDAIETVSTFCFPDNAHIYAEKPDSSIHFLVLTDVYRSKTYASCLTFYRPYWLAKEKNGNIHCVPDDPNKNSNKVNADNCVVRCYLPQCCVLVSKYPYFYAMKECLSCMISHIERDFEEMYHFLKDFTYTMTMAPVPPAGDVIVEMSVCNLSVPLFPPESPEKPVIDLPLHLVFLCFPIDEVLKIFTAVLCEERLVFVSFNYALLTTVMESFLYFILPFNWRFTYVPILSTSCLELLDAPGTFIMGCHSKHLNDVVKVEGLVVVNIDEGIVSVNGPEPLTPISPITPADPRQAFVFLENISQFPDLPSEPANIFKNICRRAKFQRELSDVQRPFYYNIEEERAFRMKKCLQFNTEISFIFLEMMVNLFRGTLPFLRIDHQLFNKQRFMETIPESDKPFYEKVLITDMFKQFLEDRLKGKLDYWSDYEKKTQPYTKRHSGPGVIASPVGSKQRHQSKSTPKQVSVTTFNSLSQRVFEVFRLPTLNDSVSYVRNAIGLLNKNIEECRSIELRSSYIYLRGMFHAAEGNVESALTDLLSLYAHNARLLPMSLVYTLLQQLPEADREDMLRKRGITDLHDPAPGRLTRPKLMAKVPIPDCDLSLDDFVKTVSLLDMATDYETIKKLFEALAHPQRPTYVDKYTFDVLRMCYEENLAQCDALVLPNDCLQVSEMILRVSNLIKTDFGMGRIILTDKRLFFIKDVSNKCREIVKLRNIAQLEKVQYHSFLRPVDCLLITETGNKVKFAAWLKTERNCWAALIEEMRAGKIVAEAIKDFTAIGQAIHNVLLIDAVIRSGQDESVAHYGQVTHAAETLCHFTSYMAEGRHILPRDTTSALQRRVDPNIGHRERQTVLCMLYTAGHSSNSIPPRLWCAMGRGQVRVFDATSWTLEESFIQTKNEVSALVAVSDSQVWAGSHGIFVIDTETISCNKTLMDHPDRVVDIILTHQGRYVYSGSVDGTIIQWELQTLRVTKKICLPSAKHLRNIRLCNDRLWCGTWHCITALDLEGTPLEVFTHMQYNTGKCIELDCFEVFNNEIWAGCRREGQVVIWDEVTAKQKTVLTLDCNGISVLLVFGDKVWVGTKDGVIYVYNSADKQLWKTIRAHDDAVRSMCAAESRYVMSGAGSKDGRVAIWSPNLVSTDLEFSPSSSSE